MITFADKRGFVISLIAVMFERSLFIFTYIIIGVDYNNPSLVSHNVTCSEYVSDSLKQSFRTEVYFAYSVSWMLPLLGAVLTDNVIGPYKSIILGAVMYVICIIMFIVSTQFCLQWIQNLSVIFLTLGAGICFPTLISQLLRTRSGKQDEQLLNTCSWEIYVYIACGGLVWCLSYAILYFVQHDRIFVLFIYGPIASCVILILSLIGIHSMGSSLERESVHANEVRLQNAPSFREYIRLIYMATPFLAAALGIISAGRLMTAQLRHYEYEVTGETTTDYVANMESIIAFGRSISGFVPLIFFNKAEMHWRTRFFAGCGFVAIMNISAIVFSSMDVVYYHSNLLRSLFSITSLLCGIGSGLVFGASFEIAFRSIRRRNVTHSLAIMFSAVGIAMLAALILSALLQNPFERESQTHYNIYHTVMLILTLISAGSMHLLIQFSSLANMASTEYQII